MKPMLALAALALIASPAAFAEDPAPMADETETEAVIEETEAERKAREHREWLNTEVCKSDPLTGSRIRKHKVCHTNAEWEQLRDANGRKHRDLGRIGKQVG